MSRMISMNRTTILRYTSVSPQRLEIPKYHSLDGDYSQCAPAVLTGLPMHRDSNPVEGVES